MPNRDLPHGAVVRPPATSRMLRLYETAVPIATRAALHKRLSPAMRARLARGLTEAGPLTRARDRITTKATRLRNHSLGRDGRVRIVRTAAGTFIAMIMDAPTPRLVRNQTVASIMDSLRKAGLSPFAVRSYSDIGPSIAVIESGRRTFVAAVRDLARTMPLYAMPVFGGKVGRMSSVMSRRFDAIAARSPVLRLTIFVTDPTGHAVFDQATGCDIEFWTEEDRALVAPRPNRVADILSRDGEIVAAPEPVFMRTPMPEPTVSLDTRREFLVRLIDDITFPIDVVYTWVDGSDVAWRARRSEVLTRYPELNLHAYNESRFISRDELKFSMRSLHQYAPWIGHIWLVTDGQVPSWLDISHSRITVVDHKEIFGIRGTLPTFNSHAIETQLHNIPGLSEHFLYFNDDVFLGRPIAPDLFFSPNGVSRFFPSSAKIDPAPPNLLDAPVTAAGKNNRRVILDSFGRTVTYKMRHCPHALRRSIMAEVSDRFADAVEKTAHHQFRHVEDVSLPSSLYHYYAHETQRAIASTMRYMYTDLAAPETLHRLRLTLARRDFDVMCLNDTDSDPGSSTESQVLIDFLSRYFPVPAPWERSEPSVSQK